MSTLLRNPRCWLAMQMLLLAIVGPTFGLFTLLQTHDSEIDQLQTGYRGALNLAGIQKDQLYRGQVLVEPDLYVPVTQLNAFVTVLPDSDLAIKNLMRVRVHLHTIEVIGRLIVIDRNDIRPGEGGYIQIRLEKSIYASVKDRFIIRQFSPQITIGGGVVLDTNPPKYRKRHAELLTHQLELLRSESVSDRILGIFSVLSIEPHSLGSLKINSGLSMMDLERELKKLEGAKKIATFSRAKETFYCSIDQLMIPNRIWNQIKWNVLNLILPVQLFQLVQLVQLVQPFQPELPYQPEPPEHSLTHPGQCFVVIHSTPDIAHIMLQKIPDNYIGSIELNIQVLVVQ